MKRVIALLLTLVMLLGLVPTALAAEAAAPDGTVVKAEEVSGTPRLDAMADAELLRRNKARLKFSRKVSAALVEEAVDSLAQAKAMHDELEALYNPYVDFDRVGRMADRIAGEILKES